MARPARDSGAHVEAMDVRQWLREDEQHGRDAPAAVVSKPRQVQCWSKTSVNDGGRYLYGETSGLGVYREPALPADLNAGYPDAFVRKPDGESTPVEVIIGAVQAIQYGWSTTTVCTFRNNLNKLCLTPLQPADPWVVDAAVHGPTLFLDIVKTPEASFPKADLFNYYGYKFEALCTAGPDAGLVDSTSEYAIVVRLALGQHNVLMAAEVDCCEEEEERGSGDAEAAAGSGQGPHYVELKTLRLPTHPSARAKVARDKYPRFWVQSFLGGVPTLVLGNRDDKGSLLQVDRVPVAQLPALARLAGQPFDAFRLLRFADAALAWMDGACRRHPHQQLRFEYVPAAGAIQATVMQEGQLPARLAKALRDG